MKRLFFTSFVLFIFSLCIFVQAQTTIENFDNSKDSVTVGSEGPPTTMIFTNDSTDFKEGSASLHVKANIGAFHQWGSFASVTRNFSTPQNWLSSDSISIWLKVTQKPAIPSQMFFRIQIADQLNSDGSKELHIYENAVVCDSVAGWVQLRIPLYDRPNANGTVLPNDSGFVLIPAAWNNPWNDKKLNLDKIVSFELALVTSGWATSGNLQADSIGISFDGFERFGNRALPAIIFNGLAVPSQLSAFSWGQSTLEVETGTGAHTGHNSVKWTQGNEWGNGWSGVGWNISPAFNLAGAWAVDSLKFKMKAESGVGALRAQFESGAAKKGIVFTPTADGAWHNYSLALKDFVYQDNTSGFDTSNVTVFGFMAEATAVAGKVINFDDIWTGNPVFDVIAPAAPVGVAATTGTYVNNVVWDDVANEVGETYNVYYSTSPFTAPPAVSRQANGISTTYVEVAALNIAHGVKLFSHVLRAPATDASVTYYYAVTCTDAAGNRSVLSTNTSAITNTAKGVPVIGKAPATFAADGDLSEWAGVTPFRTFLSDNSGYKVTNTSIDNDADLSALTYVAMDQNNLYVAFKVTDNIVSSDTTKDNWMIDSPDLFIGLYDYHGASHTSYKRGAQPDYHFRFNSNLIRVDNLGKVVTYNTDPANPNYFWKETFGVNEYIVEAKISFASLAALGGDSLFVPNANLRLPIDIAFNDADATGLREGIMTYSPYNEDKSYQDVSRWLYTWTSSTLVGIEEDKVVPVTYELSQNYPNPFNPSTQITYSIMNPGFVSLKIYDILGREIMTLVNQEQNVGRYNVKFDASKLSSGVYFYRIEAGSFVSVKKMMLLK